MYISRIEREVVVSHLKFIVYTVNMVFLFICNESSTFINITNRNLKIPMPSH